MSGAAGGSSARIRLAYVYRHLEIGGIERRILDLLPRFDPQRFEARMICTRRRGHMADELEAAGIPIEVARCHTRLPLAWSAVLLARSMRRHPPDIVHAHAEDTVQAATMAARLAGVPIVVGTFHSEANFGIGALRRERRQWPQRGANVYVSEAVRRDHLARIRPSGGTSVVLQNGVDLARFAAPPSRERMSALRQEIRLNGQGPVLLSVGRLQRVKSPGDLLRAFSLVRNRLPGAVLVLAGGGRRTQEVSEIIRACNLDSSVRMLGMRDDVADLYHLADLHLLASRTEGFSLVVLEAMAAGLPQVLTAVGGNPEAVGDSGAARLVPSGRPEELARAVVDVLESGEQSARMRDAARRRAAQFSLDEQRIRTERLYEDLASRAAVPGAALSGR